MCSWDTPLADVGFYDFDPKLAKKSSAMTGLHDLESDGSNLATVLYKILGKPETRKRFTALLCETLPQIEEINVQRHLDRTLVYRIAETETSGDFFPAPLLSDGTVNITAMIAAVFFEKISMAVLEEPERNLHPALVRAVVELLRDASAKRQVIVSTHSPELVKYSGVESLVFVRRGANGTSEVVRPSDSDTVRAFLEKDIGLDKVFVMDMLDADAADA
jgi:predicted ATPase